MVPHLDIAVPVPEDLLLIEHPRQLHLDCVLLPTHENPGERETGAVAFKAGL